jgi:hypothetical protein
MQVAGAAKAALVRRAQSGMVAKELIDRPVPQVIA